MDWANERYVRLYTRDTGDWVSLGWEAQALLMLIMRKVDRAGVLDMGRRGTAGLAALVNMPADVVGRSLALLVDDGCIHVDGTTLVIRNFIEANEAHQSDRQRQYESRARRRDVAKQSELHNTCHTESQPVTVGHSVPYRAVPYRAVPDIAAPAAPPGGTAHGSSSPIAPELPGISTGAAAPAERVPAEKPCCVPSDDPAKWLQRAEWDFCRLHRERLGLPYVHAYARDRKALKQLPEAYRPRLSELVQRFFDAADDFVFTKSGVTVPAFVGKVSTLLGGVAKANVNVGHYKHTGKETYRGGKVDDF